MQAASFLEAMDGEGAMAGMRVPEKFEGRGDRPPPPVDEGAALSAFNGGEEEGAAQMPMRVDTVRAPKV